jgi:hypothetical protein
LGTRTRVQRGEQEEGTSRWQDFEKLAEKILAELQPLAEVRWDDRIYGHLSAGNRQIDVSIRWTSGDDKYLTIVQAKDQGHPADIKVVDEFLSVIRDVQATGGILICRKGFSKRAEAYARNCGISLFNMHDAESLTWSQQLKVPIIWTELTANAAVKWDLSSLEPGDTMPKNHSRGPDFTVDRIRRIDPIAAFERHWNGPTAQRGLGATHILASDDETVEIVVRDANGELQFRPASNFRIEYTIERRSWLGEFEPKECRGLIDYLDGQAFKASYLPLSEIPMRRDSRWHKIDSPEGIAVTIRGTVVTATGYHKVKDMFAREIDIEPLEPEMSQS